MPIDDTITYGAILLSPNSHFNDIIHNIDPLEAMLKGQHLVRTNKLSEGLEYLNYAKKEFLSGIIENKKNIPELYLFIENSYLLMISASFGFNQWLNIDLIDERKRFHEKYNVIEKIKGVSYPLGYVLMQKKI